MLNNLVFITQLTQPPATSDFYQLPLKNNWESNPRAHQTGTFASTVGWPVSCAFASNLTAQYFLTKGKCKDHCNCVKPYLASRIWVWSWSFLSCPFSTFQIIIPVQFSHSFHTKSSIFCNQNNAPVETADEVQTVTYQTREGARSVWVHGSRRLDPLPHLLLSNFYFKL